MNTTTPSKIAPRRSGRATKANPRFSSPGYVVARPQHQSAAPIDATIWSMRYLQRQDARSQSWFCHLDFAKVADEDIKKIFWTGFMEKSSKSMSPSRWQCGATLRSDHITGLRKDMLMSRFRPLERTIEGIIQQSTT